MGDTYTHGHHASVLRSHTWRTVENSAPHLVPHLRAGLDVLDVGCGPGTITLDLAGRVAPGRVEGIDTSAEVVAAARAAAADLEGVTVSFAVGDAYDLHHAEGSFDVVHGHQVLQHLSDPVAALREARRVLRPGGIAAFRDSDYAAFAWAPRDPMLDRWNELYHELTAANGAAADAGRHLLRWARAAGFTDITLTGSVWVFADDESRTWWGSMWADRVMESSYATQAIERGLSDLDELAAIAAAWRRWASDDDAAILVPHGELIARR